MKTILALSFTLSVFLSVSAQVGFQVSPGKVFFQQAAGQPATQSVTITNSTPNPLVLQCTFSDWIRDSMGDKIYAAPGFYPTSNSKFLKVVPESFSLAPGESKAVEVSMLIPPGSDKAVSNSMLFVTQINEKDLAQKDKNKQAMMLFRIQIGIHIYNEPPQLQNKNIEIEDVVIFNSQVKTPKPGTATEKRDSIIINQQLMKAYIQNKGDLIAEGTLRFELTHQKTLKEFKPEPVPFNSLPGDKLVLSRVLPTDLPKGKYSVVTIADFGTDQPLKVAETEIEIK